MTKPIINPATIRAVAARHPDIPQDALPGLETVERDTSGSKEPSKHRSPVPSVRRARCPKHKGKGDDDLTGVVLSADGSEVFRDHTKRVGNHTIRCSGSGMVAP